MAQLPRSIGRGICLGGSLENGRIDNGEASLSLSGLRRANALLLGMDTLLGPVYFAVGRTQGGESAAYLFVGRR
jgi:NTE family protein